MIRGLYNAFTDARVRREWRWLAFRRIGKWSQPSFRTLDWARNEPFTDLLQRFGEAESLHAGNRWNLWIPDRFGDIRGRRFAFVHVDVDLERPTRESLDFFYPRLNAGGILLCDDYGFAACPGVTRAVDTFLANKPEKLVALSSGAVLS